MLRTTVRIIEERGSVEFTMREVANNAGVTHPALYKHFVDKRAVLVQIALEGYGRLEAAIEAGVDLAADRAMIAKDAAAVYVAFALEHPAHFRVMFGPRLNHDEQYPELERAVQTAYLRLFDAMGGRGSLASADNREAHDRSFALWSMIHGYALLVLDDRVFGLNAEKKKRGARAHVRRLAALLAQSFGA